MTVVRDGVRPAGATRLLRATQNSWRGLRNCYRSEAAFRQELWVSLLLAPVALWLGRSGVERSLLLGALLLLLIVELLNTAIEVVVDRIGVERHHLSGFAKDLGSCAVLFALLLACLVWALVAWDVIISRQGSLASS
ncbi:MAG: diacylglycerol kinase [Steroidobacteraceae bacterium]